MAVDVECIGRTEKTHQRVFCSKPAWYKTNNAHITAYREHLSFGLNHVILPTDALHCTDILCKNANHVGLQTLNNYANSIVKLCLCSAKINIPVTAHNAGSKSVAGWGKFLVSLREKSLFWHNVWFECGRPHSGVVADIMRKTRAAYHYAFRQVRRNKNDIVKRRFANAVLENNVRDFWYEAKNWHL